MNKNEIVAIFMGYKLTSISDLSGYYERYDNLMPAWVKFRDLKFSEPDDNPTMDEIKHLKLCASISWSITNKPITEAFDELVSGINWYNSIKKS